MSESKVTPGEWVATAPKKVGGRCRVMANARLMASAKEMYEQLLVFKTVLSWESVRSGLGANDHAQILKNLNRVIEKALPS